MPLAFDMINLQYEKRIWICSMKKEFGKNSFKKPQMTRPSQAFLYWKIKVQRRNMYLILKVLPRYICYYCFCCHIQSLVTLESVIVETAPYFEHTASLTNILFGIFHSMTQAVFIDFQAMQPGAVGRDIWNYLYTATDSGSLHLFKLLAVGWWITWFISCWEDNNCSQSWAYKMKVTLLF